MTTADPDSPPTAFFTLSLLIDSSQINGLADSIVREQRNGLAKLFSRKKRVRFWSQDLLKKIRPVSGAAENQALHDDINPMFEDISDRSRNLFIEDFLLDTPGGDPEASDHRRNVFAEISLCLDGPIDWKAEGPVFKVDTEGPIVFEKVLCRAFWMAHSNNALSYHLSFEVPFEHGLKDYLGLSLFQKVFSPSESTDWVVSNNERGWKVLQAGGTGERVSLLGFMEKAFERDLAHLMEKLPWASMHSGGISKEVIKPFCEMAWQQLVLQPAGEANEKVSGRNVQDASGAASWVNAAHRRRLLVLLRDNGSFEALQKARDCAPSIVQLGTLLLKARQKEGYTLAALNAEIDKHACDLEVQDEVHGKSIRENYLRWLFLSGYFQNVVDFLDQDGLEVHDGLAPVYPREFEGEGINPGFMLYATPSVLFEVVRKSRSLDKAGRRWLGTCPYLFLVHMTAFQNESLVRAYEGNVTCLLKYLEKKGLKSDEADSSGSKFGSALAHASACIQDFQLQTFEKVHKHYSFNVFRYQTEQDFFECVEDIRGIKQRRAYWDEVLIKLTQTIESLQEHRRARYEKKIALVGVLLALSGVWQVVLTIAPTKPCNEYPPLPLLGKACEYIQYGNAPLIVGALAGGLLWGLWQIASALMRGRFGKDPAKAWRGAS